MKIKIHMTCDLFVDEELLLHNLHILNEPIELCRKEGYFLHLGNKLYNPNHIILIEEAYENTPT